MIRSRRFSRRRPRRTRQGPVFESMSLLMCVMTMRRIPRPADFSMRVPVVEVKGNLLLIEVGLGNEQVGSAGGLAERIGPLRVAGAGDHLPADLDPQGIGIIAAGVKADERRHTDRRLQTGKPGLASPGGRFRISSSHRTIRGRRHPWLREVFLQAPEGLRQEAVRLACSRAGHRE